MLRSPSSAGAAGKAGVVVEASSHSLSEGRSLDDDNCCNMPAELPPTTKSARSQERFRRLFKDLIPAREELRHDASCAYQKRILWQGRLYVTARYVCFHANILGHTERVVLKLTDVNEVRKRTTAMIFKNALQFLDKDGQSHIFRTFLHRGKTYAIIRRLLCWNWQHELGRPALQEQELRAEGSSSVLETDDVDSDDRDSVESDGEEPTVELSRLVSVHYGQPLEEEDWEDGPATPMSASDVAMETIVEASFDGLTVEEWFYYFFGDKAKFSYADFLTAEDYSEVELGEWAVLPDSKELLGHVRDCDMRVAVKSPPPTYPDTTRIHSVQSYRYKSNVLIISFDTVTLDVPYGSAFKMLQTWTVKPSASGGAEGVDVTIEYGVQFVKSVWGVKGIIRSRSKEETKESMTKWVQRAKASLEEEAGRKAGRRRSAPARGSAPATETKTPTPPKAGQAAANRAGAAGIVGKAPGSKKQPSESDIGDHQQQLIQWAVVVLLFVIAVELHVLNFRTLPAFRQ